MIFVSLHPYFWRFEICAEIYVLSHPELISPKMVTRTDIFSVDICSYRLLIKFIEFLKKKNLFAIRNIIINGSSEYSLIINKKHLTANPKSLNK